MHWITAGAFACALSVAAGAFGAHGLKERLDASDLALWETAARYLMYAGLGTTLCGLLAAATQPRRGLDVAAGLLLSGGLVFGSTVAVLALGGPRWLGAVTPLGGLGMIVGFVVLGIVALRPSI